MAAAARTAAAARGGGRPAAAAAARARARPNARRAAPRAAAAAVEGSETAAKGRSAPLEHMYRSPLLSPAQEAELAARAAERVSARIVGVRTEACFNIDAGGAPLGAAEADKLRWLLRETFEPEMLTADASLAAGGDVAAVVEVGPRMSFTTAWSTNAVSVCKNVGLGGIRRVERSRRYALVTEDGASLSDDEVEAFAAMVHDRMTEQVYPETLASFYVDATPAPVETVPLLAEGKQALRDADEKYGFAFDDFDVDFYAELFGEKLGRDPTTVELFDLAQSNSEHSRHWFFKGAITVDGEPIPMHLLDMVRETLDASPDNSVVAFKDNSSAIRGGKAIALRPTTPGEPGELTPQEVDLDLLLTAETHNFPSGVAPFPGAETGAGGRIRDTHATGSGSIMGGAAAGYSVGNLQIPEAPEEHEDASFEYPDNLATPLQILLDASDGASDYGNKFGEPLIGGFTRSYGQRLPNGERREYIKPIMFSSGFGQIDHRHLEKGEGEVGMLVVKIGGPAYRIGLGGGAASSKAEGEGTGNVDLDFNAVQRGDAEMSQKLWRVVRACVELGDDNPIVQIHDQGAGGNCNVVKELIYPGGATIDIRAVNVGDETLSVLEIWGAEYQENDAMLIKPESEHIIRKFCERERLPMAVLGAIDGSGRVTLLDTQAPEGSPPPEDLDLEDVLGDMPQKKYDFVRAEAPAAPLVLPGATSVSEALEKVLRLPAVCSKRFLTSKVDRCVTGLVAQQQCVGPLQLPLADYAAMARSHYTTEGGVTAIGERPISGLLSPAAMGRMSLGEALTNLSLARITDLSEVKSSGNWMYAAKLAGEGANLVDACEALKDAMIELKVAIDGGKDSLSMAAKAGGETVMAPGTLVMSMYVPSPDVTKGVTPDLKLGDGGVLLHVDLARGRRRVGASALSQVYNQLGAECPDLDEVSIIRRLYDTMQPLLEEGLIASGHDISDGGIATTLLEMAFGGDCGIECDLPPPASEADAAAVGGTGSGATLAALFAEELGLVLEVAEADAEAVAARFAANDVPCVPVGRTLATKEVTVSVGGAVAIVGDTAALRDEWEATSWAMERRQRTPEAVASERARVTSGTAGGVPWRVPFELLPDVAEGAPRHKVAVIREEGSNGDREMAAALHMAGLAPHDVTMSDLIQGHAKLDDFRGAVFVGGFSYADVLDSAKGWAGCIRFSDALREQFDAFYEREDTLSLGVCNGCQLEALLGWVGQTEVGAARLPDTSQPRFVHNDSGRFECRYVGVGVQEGSPAVLLDGMEGANLGVWIAHGEGRAYFPDDGLLEAAKAKGLAPLRYIDESGAPTEAYPQNPNGAPAGIAGLCSADGRHLAMMPHPERCFLNWQLPHAPAGVDSLADPKAPSPWLRMFQNMRVGFDSFDAAQ